MTDLCPVCMQSLPPGMAGMKAPIVSPDGTVRLDGLSLLVDGEEILLTAREAELFGLLLRRFGRWVHKEAIFNVLYGDLSDPPEFDPISVYLSRLRHKLRGTRVEFQNGRQEGYRLVLLDAPETKTRWRPGAKSLAVLRALAELGPSPTNEELAERAGMPQHSARSLLPHLRAMGWITFRRGPRRSSCYGRRIEVTEAGQKFLAGV